METERNYKSTFEAIGFQQINANHIIKSLYPDEEVFFISPV